MKRLRPSRILVGIAELLLPALCPACSTPTRAGEPFCGDCTPTLEAVDHPCPRCGLPLLAPSPGMPPPPCLGCVRSPPRWSSLRAPMVFVGALAVAVRRWKLGREPALTRPLAELLAPSLARYCDADALVPVPLHRARLRAREFNQSSLLARAARRLSGSRLPVEELLDRVRDTPPQSHLQAARRKANVERAFVPTDPRDRIGGKRVVLVDDVVTTGATAEACTLALLRAGAARVDVLALARTLP